ncbi:MAG TPA: nucleoside deaminase [Bacteroidales bacterium]|nr:nucleoside deaminase [Bacteroidales bacterium]
MDEIKSHNEYLDEAFEAAYHSMKNNIGGPFGAVVVKDGKVIGKGGNQVTNDNDPTAHAEIVAIRNACKSIGSFDLTGSTLYATCEPCPMCLSAIYWARISTVYYSSTRYDAASIGFQDNHIYEEMCLSNEMRTINFTIIENPKGENLFREWKDKTDKSEY